MPEIPKLVRADGVEASWADRQLAALDPAFPVLTTTEVGRPVELALPTVPGQPLPSFLIRLDLSGIAHRGYRQEIFAMRGWGGYFRRDPERYGVRGSAGHADCLHPRCESESERERERERERGESSEFRHVELALPRIC